jgi:invasion protein IalB
MNFGDATALARPAGRVFGRLVGAGALVALVAAPVLAQQPSRTPARRAPAAKPAPQPPAAPAAEPAPAAGGAPGAAQTPPLIYSPWTKVCGKEGQPNAPTAQKQVCFTIKEARLDTGQFVASAGLIELDGEQKKVLRVTLPLGLLLKHGTRMLVDSQNPMMGVYNFCLPNGCWADFDVNGDFVAKLKKGQNLTLQAFNLNGQVATFTFPLADFAKSNEGPPTDPKVLEEQQKKLQEELRKKAEQLQQQHPPQPGAQPPAPPAAKPPGK